MGTPWRCQMTSELESCLHCFLSQLVCYISFFVKRSCRSVHFIQPTKPLLRLGRSIWHEGLVRATRAADCACPRPEGAVDTRLQGSGWTRPSRQKGSWNVRSSCLDECPIEARFRWGPNTPSKGALDTVLMRISMSAALDDLVSHRKGGLHRAYISGKSCDFSD